MPDENKNPVEQAGQPPKDGATGDLPEYSKEQVAGMSKEQIADLYANSKAALKAATQRNQEAASIKKQYDEQLQSLNEKAAYYEQKYGELIEKQNELLDGLASRKPAENAAAPAAPTILQDPEKYAAEMEKKLAELSTNYQKVVEQINLIPAKLEFEKAVDKLIAQHKYVNRDNLGAYFESKGDKYPVNDQTLAQAGQEIDVAETKRLDGLIEQRKKELEALEKNATSQAVGSPATGAAEFEGFHDLPEPKQRELLEKWVREGKI